MLRPKTKTKTTAKQQSATVCTTKIYGYVQKHSCYLSSVSVTWFMAAVFICNFGCLHQFLRLVTGCHAITVTGLFIDSSDRRILTLLNKTIKRKTKAKTKTQNCTSLSLMLIKFIIIRPKLPQCAPAKRRNGVYFWSCRVRIANY